MSLKTKIYIIVVILLVGFMTYQYFSIRNLKDKLHNSIMVISVLEQNQQALKDSIAFKPDSVAILHSFIKDKDELTKSLKELYNNIKDTSDNNIKKLQDQIGLLEGEITFKDKVIDSLLVNTDNTEVTDSTITIPILYNDVSMGLTLDGKAVGNFIEKTGYVFWNKIETKLPKIRIGLVYESKDSTIIAMIQANDKIKSFKTVMSDELFRIIINNTVSKKSIFDNFCLGVSIGLNDNKNIIIGSYVKIVYNNFYGQLLYKTHDYIINKYDSYYIIGYEIKISYLLSNF